MEIDHKTLALLPFELQCEIAENLHRKNWAPSELDAVRRRCEAVLKAQARERQAVAGPSSGSGAKKSGSGKLSLSAPGQTRDKIGAFAGLSGRTVEKIAAVCEAAEAEPEKFGALAEEMDRAAKVRPGRSVAIDGIHVAIQGCGPVLAAAERGPPAWDTSRARGNGHRRAQPIQTRSRFPLAGTGRPAE